MSDLHSRLAACISDASYDWRGNFNEWALRIFAHQFENNAPYRSFCEGRGISGKTVSRWDQIPSVPTDVFKHVELFAGASIERSFRTSGTTQAHRGVHHFETTDVYRAAIPGPFKRWCMPDLKRMPMAILAPSPGDLEDSSLSFMLGELAERFGTPLESGFFIERDDDALNFDIAGLVEWLEAQERPVFLLGTAFALLEFFDATEDMSFELAGGSRVMETGGTKGRTREVEKNDLYRLIEDRLGVASTHIVSEYSMTELSSQAYTDSVGNDRHWRDACFEVPPWVKIEIVDPASLEVLKEPGTPGLIRWYDLANVDSVLAVQTSDLGAMEMEGGFKLLGRAADSELRGCSLTVEELVESTR